MVTTFYFYDLETSGLNPREDRILQFAGQRTDLNLNPIGDAANILIRLNEDTLPSPDATLVTGITPQQTVSEGHSEAEFARLLHEEICTEGTIMVGFNNIRFDDEFIRALFWRTFHDPYEWCWKDGRSRWDILDVVRMTRALRPDGIEWPVDEEGRATNRLELITKLNGVDHFKAHDALSDVLATIAVARLIKEKQPQLFTFLLNMRDKNEVKKLVNLDTKAPFVYTSGTYEAEHEKTTVAFPLTSGRNSNVVVYDLRYDPTPFMNMSQKQLAELCFAGWEERKKEGFTPLPVKELQYNRAPAVAPLNVLDKASGWERIHLDKTVIEKHRSSLISAPHFAENIRSLYESRPEFKKSPDAEGQLYDGFIDDGKDKVHIAAVRNASGNELADFHPEFNDERLSPLLLRYKARNYPESLSESEVIEWEKWRSQRLNRQLPSFVQSLQRLSASRTGESDLFLLQELQLWAESILPEES